MGEASAEAEAQAYAWASVEDPGLDRGQSLPPGLAVAPALARVEPGESGGAQASPG